MESGGQRFRIGIVGAGGVLGEEIVRTLFLREFPVETLKLFESDARLGAEIEFGTTDLPVETLSDSSLDALDAVVFAAPPEVSAQWVPVARELGLKVIDLAAAPGKGENASPSMDNPVPVPSAGALVLEPVLKALQSAGVRIERVRISGFLSVSEAGRAGISALSDGTRALLAMSPVEDSAFGQRLAFNVVPDAAQGLDDRVAQELAELIGIDRIRVSVMQAFVPVFFGHTYSIEVETSPRVPVERAFQVMNETDELELVCTRPEDPVPPTVARFAGTDEIGVGKLQTGPSGLQFWVAADNVRAVARRAVFLLEQLCGV